MELLLLFAGTASVTFVVLCVASLILYGLTIYIKRLMMQFETVYAILSDPSFWLWLLVVTVLTILNVFFWSDRL